MRYPSATVMAKAKTLTCTMDDRNPFLWSVLSSKGDATYLVQILEEPSGLDEHQLSCTCAFGKNAGPGAPGCSHVIAVLYAIEDRLNRDRTTLEYV
jgi:hypothetical protein